MIFDSASWRQYPAVVGCVLFLGLFGLFHWWKPSFAYRPDGSLKQFGLRRHGNDDADDNNDATTTTTTMFTLPAIAVGLAVLSYASVLRAATKSV